MDNHTKEIINMAAEKKFNGRYFSDKSILMPNNTQPKPSTLWHMQHIPYQK